MPRYTQLVLRRSHPHQRNTDFAKALDQVAHSILLSKKPNMLVYICTDGSHLTYSTGRNWFHFVDMSLLPSCATLGVPQASNLDPLLFLLFVND